MVSRRIFLIWFVGGLASFAAVIWLHWPLAIEGVAGGITDHQRAVDAVTINSIHHAWQAAGLYGMARIAIISDLVFIGIYGAGCILGGLYYRASQSSILHMLGWIALISGIVFLIADYAETLAQFVQLQAQVGDDGLARIVSTFRPIKIAAWTGAFVAIVAALVLEKLGAAKA